MEDSMDTLTAIEARRSVKKYDPEHRMTDAEIDTLLSMTMLSPTAFNLQHWRFVVVQDPDLRRQVREASWNQAQVTDASLLVVICADLNAWAKDPARYFANAPENVQQMMPPMINGFYRENDQMQRDEALRSCGIAAQTLMLAAKSMGYDSCPMCGFDFGKLAALINLPDDHMISMFVVVGKAVEEARPRMGQLPMSDVVIRDRF
jgi:nitroreductase